MTHSACLRLRAELGIAQACHQLENALENWFLRKVPCYCMFSRQEAGRKTTQRFIAWTGRESIATPLATGRHGWLERVDFIIVGLLYSRAAYPLQARRMRGLDPA